jgi:hypothetical protein
VAAQRTGLAGFGRWRHLVFLLGEITWPVSTHFDGRPLVDEYALVVHPVILGGGTPFFPDLERPAGLRLLETRTFSSGVVYLGFAAR